jgi:hypothetical protein
VHRVTTLIALFAIAAAACGDDDAVADATPAADDAAPPAFDAPRRPDATPLPDAAPLVAGDRCELPLELGPHPATEAGDTTGMSSAAYAGPCSVPTADHPDSVYHSDLGETALDLIVDVTVDEGVEAPFDVVLYARADCTMPDTLLGCADAGWGEHLEILDASGDIYLFVDGTHQFGGSTSGAFTLTTATRAIAAVDSPCDPSRITDRCAVGSRCVSGTCVADSAALACSEAVDLTAGLAGGPVILVDHTAPYEGDFYAGTCAADADASFPERIFKFDVSAASDLDVSTDDPTTDFDTYLYLRKDSCDGMEVGCHDDVDVTMFNLRSHLVAPALEPGTYYLFLDGSSAAPGTGDYRIVVSLTAL